MPHNGRPRLEFYTLMNLQRIPQLQQLSSVDRRAMEVVAHILPFRTNSYVVNELITWADVPNDPLFQLTFPQRGMLADSHFQRMVSALESGGSSAHVRAIADEIRRQLYSYPPSPLANDVPVVNDRPILGVQHKYNETCLVFPSVEQPCHAYCSFCSCWPQFVGMGDLKRRRSDKCTRVCSFPSSRALRSR